MKQLIPGLDQYIRESYINEANNDPKVQKLVDELNELISKAYDSDGDPIGVVDSTSTWEEPIIYEPIVYKNGVLKITSYSSYNSKKKDTETILKRNMDDDGIGTLRVLIKQYKKTLKKQSSI